ncbi:MAG: hypothetical protein WKG07_07185 [Hymenobacter sp.]
MSCRRRATARCWPTPSATLYLYGRFAEIEKLRHEYGVLLAAQPQLAWRATTRRPPGNVAEKMIDAGLVDFVGTDTHHLRHTAVLRTKAVEVGVLPQANGLLLNSALAYYFSLLVPSCR